jgi:hypothetical protein
MVILLPQHDMLQNEACENRNLLNEDGTGSVTFLLQKVESFGSVDDGTS